uniref:Uncharacterized protein n=1 Tax=Arundo donax TaxID=35708 RepID=A0A0A8Y838_ARUDO
MLSSLQFTTAHVQHDLQFYTSLKILITCPLIYVSIYISVSFSETKAECARAL